VLDSRGKIGILVPISNSVSNLQNSCSNLSRLVKDSEMGGVGVGVLAAKNQTKLKNKLKCAV